MRKTLFIASGPASWASSRIRCFWPAVHMDADVVVWDFPKPMEFSADYETYIWQKYGNPETQSQLLDAGKQVWIDHCDPMWWFSNQTFMRDTFENATGAVFSSEELRQDFLQWWGKDYNAHTIKDRLDLSHYSHKKSHHWTKPVRFIWYGITQNRVSLSGAWANLSRLKVMGHQVTLTIFDNRPDIRITEQDSIPILYSTWELDKEPPMIAGYDVALLPPFPGPWGKVKSNNKNLTASACNVPYVDGHDWEEMLRMMDHKERAKLAEMQSAIIPEHDVKISAEEWEALLYV